MDCHAIGGAIPDSDPQGRLFQTDILNKTVLIKRFEPALSTARLDLNVSTVVYFPYDYNNPYEGGESIDYNMFGFPGLLVNKIAHGSETRELMAMIEHDVEVLRMIESMHTLDPFMFKSRAEQLGVEADIHPKYFAISPTEWDRIRLPIRDKIARLVSKALGASDGAETTKAQGQHVEVFLKKIWEATDIEGVEPFVKAMQIPPDRAPDIFFAWKAVCYYQVQFNDSLNDLKTMFQWVGNNKLCFPSGGLNLSEPEQKIILKRRDALREKMRIDHVKARQIIAEYENSYNQFILNDRPRKFMDFLGNSANSYLNLAANVSTATHSINLWKRYMSRYGPTLRHRQFMELFNGLTLLNNIDSRQKMSA